MSIPDRDISRTMCCVTTWTTGSAGFERQRIEHAIRDDPDIARAFQMIREGTEVMRTRLDLDAEIPIEWLTTMSRWERL
jgi:hypothetical protein